MTTKLKDEKLQEALKKSKESKQNIAGKNFSKLVGKQKDQGKFRRVNFNG